MLPHTVSLIGGFHVSQRSSLQPFGKVISFSKAKHCNDLHRIENFFEKLIMFSTLSNSWNTYLLFVLAGLNELPEDSKQNGENTWMGIRRNGVESVLGMCGDKKPTLIGTEYFTYV